MERVNRLRKYMKKVNVEAMLISSFPNIYYYSNFSSEDGLLYIYYQLKDNIYLK